MTYRQARVLFTRSVAKLIEYADSQGDEMAMAYVKRCKDCPVGIDGAHQQCLAVDMDLYRNGKYLTSTKAHEKYGEFWKGLHPDMRWGGDFKRKDGNHFSLRFWGKS